MNIIDVEQGSPEWKLARAMCVTASNIADVLSRDRSGNGEGAMRRNYKARLVCETLTGQPQEDGFQSKAMTEGIENEPFARAAYEVHRDVMVDRVGLVVHPRIPRFRGSPDGLIAPDGSMQIKCPYPATHIAWLEAGVVPVEHQPQMLAELAVTELAWADFVSYCPALPQNLQLFVVRFMRDEKRIAEIEAEVKVFLDEVDAKVEALRKRAA